MFLKKYLYKKALVSKLSGFEITLLDNPVNTDCVRRGKRKNCYQKIATRAVPT